MSANTQNAVSTAELPEPEPVERLVLYGDFTCPWSYLAVRRAFQLAAVGIEVDWRAVEHDRPRPGRADDPEMQFAALRKEVELVQGHLLPDERLPYALAGFVPRTKAAVSGYAEAYGASRETAAAPLLFEAFWLHGIDIGDPVLVRTLLVDAVRHGCTASSPLRDWGMCVTGTGAPVTTTAYRLIRAWRAEWLATGKEVVPTLVVDGHRPLFGVDAVDWLGACLVARGVDTDVPPAFESVPERRCTDMPARSWASQHGGRWIRPFQRVG